MTNIFAIIISALITGGVISFVFYLLLKNKLSSQKEEKNDNSQFLLIQQQMQNLAKMLDSKLHESNREMQGTVRMQFGESQKLIKDITEQLTEVKESNKQVFGIAEQLENLEKVLKHQKQRGNLGEASLELILGNILPPGAYKMQYRFSNNDAVDAAIITKEGIIPVDAKFSLDNYNRITNEKDEARKQDLEKEFRNDLKKRIDETSKYIRPNEGTLPFAFMFIPAEGIYYDLLINEVGTVKVNTRSLIDYAYNEKKVMIVSPTTFAAYLQSVLYGFKAFKIEEKAQEIGKRVVELSKHLGAYEEYVKKIGTSLSTTVNHYNTAYKELKKVDKDIIKITGETSGIEPNLIEKPQNEYED